MIRKIGYQHCQSTTKKTGSLRRSAVISMPKLQEQNNVTASKPGDYKINHYHNFLNAPLLAETHALPLKQGSNSSVSQFIRMGNIHPTATLPFSTLHGSEPEEQNHNPATTTIVQRMDEDLSNKQELTNPNFMSSNATIKAYRIEGMPKSEKQKSGAKKGLSGGQEALNIVLSRTEGLTEEIKILVESDWQQIEEISNESKRETKKKSLLKGDSGRKYKKWDKAEGIGKIEQLYFELEQTKKELSTSIGKGDAIPTRLQVDGSNLIIINEGEVKQGEITGCSPCSFNFSVGTPIHSEYFSTTGTTEGKWVLMEFNLKREAWRMWKTWLSGPQQKGKGPSSKDKLMTLNDLTQPGVKYEVQPNQLTKFMSEVVDRGTPVIIKPLAVGGNSRYDRPENIVKEVERLKKCLKKLEESLSQYKGEEDLEQERTALTTGKKWVTEALGMSERKEDLSSFYEALSLTKNALHSVRRESTTN